MPGYARSLVRSAVGRLKQELQKGGLDRLLSHRRLSPPLGSINFGQLETPKPISFDFGWDRGTPIDRYYIENFLTERAGDIQGRVLEIGDDEYSRRFGGAKITRQDVLHVQNGNPKATLIGDLTQEHVLPDDVFDCIVLTQTLQLIFELEQAVRRLYNALKPGGILLLTVPGISQIDRDEWGATWCWGFTEVAIRELFKHHFSLEALKIRAHGNVFAATALLQGVALEEIDRTKLSFNDRAYPVVITLRAEKR